MAASISCVSFQMIGGFLITALDFAGSAGDAGEPDGDEGGEEGVGGGAG